MEENRIQIFKCVEELYHLVETAGKVPLSNKILVDRQALKQALQRLESSIDPDVKHAAEILSDVDKLYNDANAQAKQTVDDANANAQRTVDDAAHRAQATLQDAQQHAAEISRDAADKANAMVADAQARANAMVADAQARADQLVSENSVTLRAQQEAADLAQRTHMECDEYRMSMETSIQQALDRADEAVSMQLDQLRRLRQSFDARQSEMVDQL